MRSKGVLDRQRVAKSVLAGALVHAQEVGVQLRSEFAAVVQDGDSLPDFTLFQVQLARYLEMRLDARVAAEDRHLLELADDRGVRLRRDGESAAVQQQIIALREAVQALDVALRGVGHTVKSFFCLAGFPEYTDKLRLTVPKHRGASRRRGPPTRLISVNLSVQASNLI